MTGQNTAALTEQPSLIQKNSRKVINAWCSYDMGNSAYSLSISTVLYPIYYDEVTRSANGGSELVSFLGITLKNTVWYEYSIAFGYLIVIFLTMLLSGLADAGGYRRRFMQLFTIVGSLSCIGLYFFNGSNMLLGVGLPALAVIGFAGSLVYYNSFLPLIATPDRHNKVSARGFSMGYFGSMLLLGGSLYMIEAFELFGFTDKLSAVAFTFLFVGIWWFGIAQFAFYFLKEKPRKIDDKNGLFSSGFKEIGSVFRLVRQQKNISRFLIAFFFMSMGVQVIMIMAALFGSTELGIQGAKLIITIIIIQIVAIGGATFFGFASNRFGNKYSLMTMLVIWIFICISAYFISSELQFFILAGGVGLVMGGIQSQARSTFSKLIPVKSENTASFFTFYDSTEKLAIVLGMFSFGFLEHLSGSMRISSLLLSGFFIVSLIFIATISRKNLNGASE